tara:strand:+ start:5070 stop:5354 length:285 start_codon:yes stop_codon:yes gene_type:complete
MTGVSSDLTQILSIVVSVIAVIVPAIWYLSTKIQGLSGELRANAVRVEEKIASVQHLLGLHQDMLKEAMSEQDNFRERLAIAEVHVQELRTKIS